MPEYFEDIATERLIGPCIQPDQLNQYLLGNAWMPSPAYGPTRMFTGFVLQMMEKIKRGTLRLHYDSTTIDVTGEYDSGFNTRLIQIVHGHSKDHRSDLKQFIISLVTDQHGIPLFMEPLSGNESDKKTLLRTIEAVRKNLVTDETIYDFTPHRLPLFLTKEQWKEIISWFLLEQSSHNIAIRTSIDTRTGQSTFQAKSAFLYKYLLSNLLLSIMVM